MSDGIPKPTDVDPAARALTAAVRNVVDYVMKGVLRQQMCASAQEADHYAAAVLDDLVRTQLPLLVAAHDNLVAALNATSPGAPPIISLTTEGPE